MRLKRSYQWGECLHYVTSFWPYKFIFHLEAQTELGGLQEADRAGGGEDEDEGGDEAVADWDWPHTLGSLATGNPRLSLITMSTSIKVSTSISTNNYHDFIFLLYSAHWGSKHFTNNDFSSFSRMKEAAPLLLWKIPNPGTKRNIKTCLKKRIGFDQLIHMMLLWLIEIILMSVVCIRSTYNNLHGRPSLLVFEIIPLITQ